MAAPKAILDAQAWLNENQLTSCNSEDAQLIKETVAVLAQDHPKQKDVRPLQSKWHVAQKKNGKPRPLADVIKEMENKVIEEIQKLQQQIVNSAAANFVCVPASRY